MSVVKASLRGVLAVCALGGLSLPAFAQTDAEMDAQYGAYVLMCEAHYEQAGATADKSYWADAVSDLTASERSLGRAALGSVSRALAGVDDALIVQRCDEFKDISAKPDAYVDPASPELQAAQERVQALIPVLLKELRNAGFKPDYINDMLSVGAAISNETTDELERAKWIEIYFNDTIEGLRAQTKALKEKTLTASDWQWGCAALMSSKLSASAADSIDTGTFADGVRDEKLVVLYDRLGPLLRPQTETAARKDNLASCKASGKTVVRRYIDGPTKVANARTVAVSAGAK